LKGYSQCIFIVPDPVPPTHHHHDHALGVRSYVENGAEIIVPRMAQSYYAEIPGAEFATYEYVTIRAWYRMER
jgi:glyoxylase-like metal-dependent hydrolase (beta-lactamase superfamily II)